MMGTFDRRRVLLGGLGGVVAAGTGRMGRVGAQEPAASGAGTGNDGLAAGMAGAAEAFLASLGGDGLTRARYAFDDAERQRWHWTVPSSFPRNGLPLNEMDREQRGLGLDLLRASVSEAGYRKALDIMSLQRDLGNDPELYYVTVFGEPAGAAPWGWRFEGHHLSRNFAVVDGRVAVTPFFLGAWPTVNGAGLKAMEREEEAARELVRSLDGARQEAVIFQVESLTEHVTQNEPRVEPLAPVGLPVGEFDGAQQGLAREIVDTYLGVLPAASGAPLAERIDGAGFEEVRFGWAGSLEPGLPHYYRLQGPTFLLEFDNSRNSGTHIHSVWRDFEEDFGAGAG